MPKDKSSDNANVVQLALEARDYGIVDIPCLESHGAEHYRGQTPDGEIIYITRTSNPAPANTSYDILVHGAKYHCRLRKIAHIIGKMDSLDEKLKQAQSE